MTDQSAKTPENAPLVTEQTVWEALKLVYDPEVPINIVDLGLVYDVVVEQRPGGASKVQVKMTLTTPGCAMAGMIASEARHRLRSLPGVAEADVALVWDPPWHQSMISAEGRKILGLE